MAQWSTLPCCSCLFSTAHPHNEIASLQQFALTQHSGRACRCSSCTGKRWENELVPVLKKQVIQITLKHLHNVFVKLHINAAGVDDPVWHTQICRVSFYLYTRGPAETDVVKRALKMLLMCKRLQRKMAAHMFSQTHVTYRLLVAVWQVICTVSHQKCIQHFLFFICRSAPLLIVLQNTWGSKVGQSMGSLPWGKIQSLFPYIPIHNLCPNIEGILQKEMKNVWQVNERFLSRHFSVGLTSLPPPAPPVSLSESNCGQK